MKILYYPPKADNNIAIRIWKDCIESLGIKVFPLQKNIKYILTTKVNAVYLQWFENLPPNKYKAFFMYIIKICMILFFKQRKYSIYFVMHNKMPHDKNNLQLSKSLLKFILLKADSILILSQITTQEIHHILKNKYLKKNIKSKIHYLPHPNYINTYPTNYNSLFTRQSLNIKEDDFVYLFLGQVRQYKNIELLIEVFNKLNLPKSKLIIAGKVESDSYKKQIESIIINNNIITIFNFIPDEELPLLIKLSDIMVYPLDLRSSLNSGAIYLAFSNGKSVISPIIGTVLDIKNYQSLLYSYNYQNKNEHLHNLMEQMKKCYEENYDDRTELIKKGSTLLEYMKEEHSIENIKTAYSKIFNNKIKEY